MRDFTPLEFAAFLAAIPIEIEHAKREALTEGAKIIKEEAKRVLGTYDYGWQQLAPATQDDRVKKGFSANEPGVRTGEMKDSIGYEILSSTEADIGSNEDKMVYFELGTSTQPARPTLAGAAHHKGEEIAKVLGKSVMKVMLEGRDIGSILP